MGSIGAIFGGVILFAVVAPEKAHAAVKSFSLDRTAVDWHHHHGFMGKDNSAWKDVDWETVKATKMGFFERAKTAQSAEEVSPLSGLARPGCQGRRAGRSRGLHREQVVGVGGGL